MMYRSAVVLIAGAALAGCSTNPAPDHNQAVLRAAVLDPAGTYQLATVDGDSLPARPVDRDRPPEAPPAPEIVSATLVMESGGTFRQTMKYRITRGDTVREMERQFTGTWERDATGYRLMWTGAGATPARLEGDAFTYDNMGMLLRFTRQR